MKKSIYLVLGLLLCSSVYAQSPRAVDAAMSHFIANARSYGLSNPAQELNVRSVRDGGHGITHIRYDQFYNNVRVFEGEAIAHVDAAGRVRVTNALRGNLRLDTVPTVNKYDAAMTAIINIAPRGYYDPPAVALEVLPKGDRSPANYLVWHVTAFIENYLDGTARWEYFIEAHSGDVVFAFNSLPTETSSSTAKTMFVGDVSIPTDFRLLSYFLQDPLRGTNGGNYTSDLNHATSGTGTIFDRLDGIFGNNQKNLSDSATAGGEAHYGMTLTWDYFKTRHSRNGIDGIGSRTYSRVHYGSNYENAFWSDTCFCMTYGDGGATFYPLVSIDVTGHEMAHGVMSKEANLTYNGESGGLNEASSDIFGTLVEFDANNPSDTPDYWIGERIYRANWSSDGTTYTEAKALRYMDDPRKDGASPACWGNGIGSLNVHYSSGPANHMFWMLSSDTGTQRISKCNGRVVTGVGRIDAARIWYKAISDYMTSSTKYRGARVACLNAAQELFGQTSPQYNAVNDAFAAINVR